MPLHPASGLHVFAVEDTSVQLTWSALPARRLCIGVGPASVEVEPGPPAWLHRRHRSSRVLSPEPAGPGAVTLCGLRAATTYELWWRVGGGPRRVSGTVTTLAPPPGALLSRFATVSDLHIGEKHFGLSGTIEDVTPRAAAAGPYPERALAAALAEASAWGAETLLVKGDLTASSRPDQFRRAAELLGGSGLRTFVQLGNHDRVRRVDPVALLQPLPVASGAEPLVADLPGVRLVLGDSPSPSERRGRLDRSRVDRIAEAVGGAPAGRAMLSLHHPPQRWPLPMSYPPGLVFGDTRRLLAALRGATPTPIVLAGHSHRNRTYRLGGCVVAEVGSTKDYPGVWAGYAVYEGGVRQVVRRVEETSVIRWTEATAAALGGVWGRWSPGGLADRCWSERW